MIQANELRIGNLVLRKAFLPENNNYHEITVTHHDIEACVRSFADFEPILLTEQWLLKFGFEIKQGAFGNEYWGKINIYTTSNKKFVLCFDNLLKEIKHVHQLQNLYFALTGEELTYET